MKKETLAEKYWSNLALLQKYREALRALVNRIKRGENPSAEEMKKAEECLRKV